MTPFCGNRFEATTSPSHFRGAAEPLGTNGPEQSGFKRLAPLDKRSTQPLLSRSPRGVCKEAENPSSATFQSGPPAKTHKRRAQNTRSTDWAKRPKFQFVTMKSCTEGLRESDVPGDCLSFSEARPAATNLSTSAREVREFQQSIKTQAPGKFTRTRNTGNGKVQL